MNQHAFVCLNGIIVVDSIKHDIVDATKNWEMYVCVSLSLCMFVCVCEYVCVFH